MRKGPLTIAAVPKQLQGAVAAWSQRRGRASHRSRSLDRQPSEHHQCVRGHRDDGHTKQGGDGPKHGQRGCHPGRARRSASSFSVSLYDEANCKIAVEMTETAILPLVHDLPHRAPYMRADALLWRTKYDSW